MDEKVLGVYLTPKELEEELGISYSAQFKMRNSKILPYTRIGGRIVYNKIEIQKWLENNSYNKVNDACN